MKPDLSDPLGFCLDQTEEELEQHLDRWAPAASGARNMQLDCELLERTQAGRGLLFRLYRFHPACLSYGRSQLEPPLPPDLAEVDRVRRPTGGKGLLHERADLTYAVAVPAEHPLARLSLAKSYRILAQPVADGLEVLGLKPSWRGAPIRVDPRQGGACFLDHLPDTLCIGSAKIAGSAQVRQRGGVLQHGSILIRRDPHRLARILEPTRDLEEASRELSQRTIGVREALLQDPQGLDPRLRELLPSGPDSSPSEGGESSPGKDPAARRLDAILALSLAIALAQRFEELAQS